MSPWEHTGTIFITGVSSGLGFNIASHALAHGAKVIGTVRDVSNSSSALSQLSFESPKFHAVTLDVTDKARIPSVIDDAIKHHGPIDVLINNAGYSVLGPVEMVSDEESRHQMETCYFGPVTLIRAILPHFRERRRGTIVNITSVAGFNGLPGVGIYAASKFALEGTSESLAAELAPLGIRVILVEPGAFRTEFLSPSNLKLAGEDKKWAEDYLGDNPANVVIDKMIATNGKQPGDPEKAAHRLLEVIWGTGYSEPLKGKGTDGKVLRVLMGSDSLVRLKAAVDSRQQTLTDLEALAKSCDHSQ
jgi:NAD(P)-dependent dehydrogenase (short-subunit alcohol dehydrogenase family)